MKRYQGFWKAIQRFRASRQKYAVTGILLLIVIALGIYSYVHGNRQKDLVYAESLDLETVEVNGEILTLRDLAFYVAYEEEQVERQAVVYDPQNPSAYWNKHTNGTYIRKAARNAAIQMAIHDEIFYQLAMEDEIVLTEEEQEAYIEYTDDFWSDLTDDGREKPLGVEYGDILEVMQKIAYAQKMQLIYAELHNTDYDAYNFSESIYQEFLEGQNYTIYKNVWSRIPFGRVTY